jgi:hypothetical protein
LPILKYSDLLSLIEQAETIGDIDSIKLIISDNSCELSETEKIMLRNPIEEKVFNLSHSKELMVLKWSEFCKKNCINESDQIAYLMKYGGISKATNKDIYNLIKSLGG